MEQSNPLKIEIHVEDDSTLYPLIEATIVNPTDEPQTFNTFACGFSFINLRWYDVNTQERIRFVLPPSHPRGDPRDPSNLITLQPGDRKVYKFDLESVRSHVTRQPHGSEPREATFLCRVKMAGISSEKFQVTFGTTEPARASRKDGSQPNERSAAERTNTNGKGCQVM